MTATGYDIVTVGGGVGGASFARSMAASGRRVLVLERETQFKDRVRGEWLSPWGVEETRLLGIYGLLRDAGAHELPKLLAGNGVEDLAAQSPENHPSLTFYHSDAQTVLLAAAADAGAEIVTGARVTDVRLGSPPSLAYTRGGEVHEITARLVVGADGRTSLARKAIGREEREHRASRLLAGVLLDDLDIDEEIGIFSIGQPGALAAIFPQGNRRARAYVLLQQEEPARLKGDDGLERFIGISVEAGVAPSVFASCRAVGPLVSFVADDSWIEMPYEAGVVLIGDAAGVSDPTWGMGLSLTFRDARILRDCLDESDDWDAAARDYAAAHDDYFQTVITAESWQADVLLARGPDANALRARVFPQWAQDPTRRLNLSGLGPRLDVSEEARRRFFCEDVAGA